MKYRRNQSGAMGWEAALCLLFAVLFAGVVLWLFAMRFERGDAYPPYSSLRTDPMGCKALVESLMALPKRSVERNFRPLGRLAEPGGASVWLLGTDVLFLADKDPARPAALTRIAESGGRLLVAFSAEFPNWPVRLAARREPRSPGRAPEGKKQPSPDRPEAANHSGPPEDWPPPDSLPAAWGVRLDFTEASPGHASGPPETSGWRQARLASSFGLPQRVPWRSWMYFKDLDPAWQTVYTCAGKPVMIKRCLGKGELILVGDAYLFSNEAMLRDRQPVLLAWWAGPSGRLLIDETHLGLEEHLGVAALGRRYGLQWLAAALGLLAGLYVWKASRPLVPARTAHPAGESAGAGPGRDHQAGLVNLMRRNLPEGQLLAICHQEWLKTVSRQGVRAQSKAGRVAAAVAGEAGRARGERDILRAYQSISQILDER